MFELGALAASNDFAGQSNTWASPVTLVSEPSLKAVGALGPVTCNKPKLAMAICI